ncbi:uncharacterized protein LOC134257591, partial [Saccostrea cucullata]|uniref:uncharacterized protein LOC134257591 n=1 Tax=Saccostrea cuccullata TaxID=36930 RepID=UPI002ED5CE69
VSISTLRPSNESTLSTETPSPTKHTSEAYIALGVITPIFLFIIISSVCFCVWKMYQRKLENTKPTPDPKFVHGEIRNRRLTVQFEGALQAEIKETRKNISHQTGNSFRSSTIPSDMSDDSSTRPSSLTSLLVSVPRIVTKEDCAENQSFKFQESVIELTENESTSSQIKESFRNPGFNTIGVDTADLRRTMKKKTESKKTLRKKFRLRRSRSSVRDSLLTSKGLKDESRISNRKPLKSIVSYGTKTVVLGIQPPPSQQKKLLRRSHKKSSFLDKINEEPSSTREKNKKHKDLEKNITAEK